MGWIDVGPADALGDQTPLGVDLDGQPVLVVRCGSAVYAVDDLCTHDGESLEGAEVESCEITCPRHGARFCLRTGEVLAPPAYEPLNTYEVKIEQGRVLIDQPD